MNRRSEEVWEDPRTGAGCAALLSQLCLDSLSPALLEFHEGFLKQAWSTINSTSSPVSCLEDEGRDWKLQASNQGLVFLVNSPFQEPTRVAPKEQKMALVLFLLRNPQAFQEPCDRDGVKYKYQNKRCSIQVVFSPRKLQESQDLCARNQGQGTWMDIFYYLTASTFNVVSKWERRHKRGKL